MGSVWSPLCKVVHNCYHLFIPFSSLITFSYLSEQLVVLAILYNFLLSFHARIQTCIKESTKDTFFNISGCIFYHCLSFYRVVATIYILFLVTMSIALLGAVNSSNPLHYRTRFDYLRAVCEILAILIAVFYFAMEIDQLEK